MTIVMVVLTCGLYPLAVFAVAQLAFPRQANGSFTPHGSELIGQSFASERFFHSRPSAAGSDGYDATASTGTNLGPTSKKLRDAIAAAVKSYDAQTNVPADAVTSSGSGLDPHISPENAYTQAPRVARANGLPIERVNAMIERRIERRFLGVYGEPRVNVLLINQELARISHRPSSRGSGERPGCEAHGGFATKA
jgi:K+-transporting ATPase ATPase C chain